MLNVSRFTATVLLVLSTLCNPSPAFAKAKIQIAILLDSSNSMDGLIDQTRSQIWKIVNYLAKVTKDNEIPDLEVALYHYGNDTLPASEGFTRLLTGFTADLDLVSEKLFSIQTRGGQEYAGWVIDSAMQELTWSRDPEDFRVIFIAGNEPFNQGSVKWQDAINRAVKGDTLVNTIYCGDADRSERDLWSAGASLGQGRDFNINQDEVIVFQESPYDADIAEWNAKLNQTYIPYGEEGGAGRQRQAVEDLNSGQNLVVRGASKASQYYRNSSWDLIDALEDGLITLEELANDGLPPEMQGMSLSEQQNYIETKKAERATIKAKIQALSRQRNEYLQKQSQDAAKSQQVTLDQAIIRSLRQQLADKGFQL